MGFLETIGKLMSGLFAGQTQKTKNDWEENLTEDQIVDLERQGCDMTEYRQRFVARNEVKKQAEEKLINDSLAVLDMVKLDAYIKTPRDLNSEFVQEVTKLGKLSDKRQQKLAESPIIYGSVVQAHYKLFEPGNDQESKGIVFVFAMDQEHMHDTEFLRKIAQKISDLKESASVPEDCRKFIQTLQDDQSHFCFKVGDSISEGADVWCATYTWKDQSALPLGYIPVTKIVPLMILGYPEVNQFAEFEIIPSKFYTK